MSGNLISIQAKTKTGVVQTIQVAEIISIDGKPYQPAENVDALFQHFNHLSGRVAAIEAIVGSRQPQE